MSSQEITFEIAPDGSVLNIKGNDMNQVNIDETAIKRLLYYTQKCLVDENVITITATSKKYTLSLTATGTQYIGKITF